MMRLQGTEFTHWVGIHMTPILSAMLSEFKRHNREIIEKWTRKHPKLKDIPPIYFSYRLRQWYWERVSSADVYIYRAMCDALWYAKSVQRKA